MINRRLVLCQITAGFHFSQWDIPEFEKYFSNVIIHCRDADPEYTLIKKDDILYVYGVGFYPTPKIDCFAKFGVLFPGFALRPLTNLIQRAEIAKEIRAYTAVFVNEGPMWESYRGTSNVYKVPHGVASNLFKKTRVRNKFKRIIQVANNKYTSPYKGRHISEAAMKLMPYKWELIPENDHPYGYIPFNDLIAVYQNADGFLSPQMVGPPPECETDCNYNGTTLEAGLSGCVVFWHDAMGLGNKLETVFEISLNPVEIAKRIQDIVNNINLEKHSLLTAEEFYEYCNIGNSIKCKVEIMKMFL